MGFFRKGVLGKKSLSRSATSAKKQNNLLRLGVERLEDKILMSVFTPTYLVSSLYSHGRLSPANGSTCTGSGLTPTQVRTAYGIDKIAFASGSSAGTGSGETI